jgi:hypothetical protein
MVKCQYCDKEIQENDEAKELTGSDGSTDGWMHDYCAEKYLICQNIKRLKT